MEITLQELVSLVGNKAETKTSSGLNSFVGKVAIIRTQSAGVWCGTVAEKDGAEIILTNARRMWFWKAAESISLSAVAKFGIDQSKSKIAPAVDSVWLEAIEIIPTEGKAAMSILVADDAKAE